MVQFGFGVPVSPITPPETVSGAARKEPLFDTAVIANNAVMEPSVEVFTNFSQFNVKPTGVTASKKYGRDTNLRGSGGAGLPARTEFLWYEGRVKVRALGADLSLAENKAVWEEINRYRQISSIEFRFQNNPLVHVQLDELPDGVGPSWGYSTHSDAVILGPHCVPDRSGKHFTLGGNPIPINQQQDFSTVLHTPEMGFQPTVDLFITPIYEGVLIRPITP